MISEASKQIVLECLLRTLHFEDGLALSYQASIANNPSAGLADALKFREARIVLISKAVAEVNALEVSDAER